MDSNVRRIGRLKRFQLWLEFDFPWGWIGGIAMAAVVVLAIGSALTADDLFSGNGEKCYNWGGRSDDTWNC